MCSSNKRTSTYHTNVHKVAQLVFFFFFSFFLACAKNVPFSSSTQLIFQLSTYIHWLMALSSSELLPVSTFHNIRSRDPAHTTRNVFLVALVWIPALLTWKNRFPCYNSRCVQRVFICLKKNSRIIFWHKFNKPQRDVSKSSAETRFDFDFLSVIIFKYTQQWESRDIVVIHFVPCMNIHI